MKQLQFFKYATIGLVLLNIGIILFFFLTKPKPPEHRPGGPQQHPMDRRAIDLLNLNKEQATIFRDLVREHSREMRSINEEQKNALEPYFATVIESVPDPNIQARLDKVMVLEKRKIEVTYKHFEKVKAILEPAQLGEFEIFVKESLNRILGKGGQKPPPPRGF